MRIAIESAWSAAGKTRPNPMVGALVVRDGAIVGSGVHQKAGEAHAEVIALADAGERARGATLYVTLEPCAHHGKTPPCVDTIIGAEVRRVVTATLDPFEEVNGKGIAKLRGAGIDVESGVLPEQAFLLNLSYFNNHVVGGAASQVTLKAAVSLDGRISAASGERTRITSEAAQLWAHRLRATRQTIIVGIETLLVDRPRLDCRIPGVVASPVPVVLDTHLRFPEEYTWPPGVDAFYVCTGDHREDRKEESIHRSGGTVLRCRERDGSVDVADLLDQLARDGLKSHLVEGGGGVFTSFVQSGLWDALYIFSGPVLLGADAVPLFRDGTQLPLDAMPVETRRVESDIVTVYVSNQCRRRLMERLV